MLKEKLVEFRKAKNLTQQGLAELMKVSRNSVTNWETGKREPRAIDIKNLALILGVSPNDFFSDSVSDIQNTQIDMQIISEKKPDKTRENFAYWGGVLDEAKKVAQYSDEQEKSLIASLLKRAYEMLVATVNNSGQEIISGKTVINRSSVFGGQNGIKIEAAGA